MPNNHMTTTMTTEHPVNNRATSFADFELFYEINMAKRIFFQTPPTLPTIDSQLDTSTD